MPEKQEAVPTETEDREAPQPADLLQLLRPLQPTRLADHVVEQLQELVLREGLEPGDRLPSERDLADRLGTSRSIISQALRTLSLMGLVEVRPGSGAYVARNPENMFVASMHLLVRSSEEPLQSVAEVRYLLESGAASRVHEVAGPEEIKEIEEAFARLEAATDSTSGWVAADHLFHAAVVRAAGNAYLEALYEAVHTSMVSVLYGRWVEREISPIWLVGANRLKQLDLHRPIVEAVRARDSEQLALALSSHHQAILEHIGQLYIDQRLASPPESESS